MQPRFARKSTLRRGASSSGGKWSPGARLKELSLDDFPPPDTLWREYCAWKGIRASEEKIVLQDYYDDGSVKMPRYYQNIAINKTMEAIANGQNRILLVMATGTGKTYTAFQILWRLWKSGTKKRILCLAPYKVIRIDMDRDLIGWRPEKGKLDKHGKPIEDRIYNQKDFDRTLILEKRTELVAEKITALLKATNRYDKTIVFCEDIDHAERMRQALVNLNSDIAAKNRRYVMRITGDNPEGKAELDNFIDPASDYPVVVTTSRLMSTGVDAQTCKLIVIDKNISSLGEFKQIIGRGTRIREEYGKLFFTIMDFRKATNLFADPDFDGDPVQIYEPPIDGPILPPDIEDPIEPGDVIVDPPTPEPPGEGRVKYTVGDVTVHVISERVQYYDKDGKLVTESLKDYSRKAIKKNFSSLDDFLTRWNSADKKQAIVMELEAQGLVLEALSDEVGKDLDPFDLVCHVAFDKPPLTRKERAENVRKKDYFTKYGQQAQTVLHALLKKYEDGGIEDIENPQVLKLSPFDKMGRPMEIINIFGGRKEYEAAIKDLEKALYIA